MNGVDVLAGEGAGADRAGADAAGIGRAGAVGVEAGVGRTALMVAAARAIETARRDALACDRFARHFVRRSPASAHWPVHSGQVPGGDADPLWGRLGRYFGLRTRVLDDYLLQAARCGARQIVLLGAGLDARAFRLGWPEGCGVFELDQPGVLAFKQRVLDDVGARPTSARRLVVGTDLRERWACALIESGFCPELPTAWLAEGLLLYLPARAESALMATVDALSAAGSTLVYEVKLAVESAAVRASPVYTTARERIGVDLLALFNGEPRPDSARQLRGCGWSVSVRVPFDFTVLYGRGPRRELHDALACNRWIFASKNGCRSGCNNG